MCHVLEVSTSGYYAWRSRSPSDRRIWDLILQEQIKEVHAASYGTYGAPRIHAELAARGLRVARKRVARLMRQLGIMGVTRRRRVVTTVRDKENRPAPDLVDRDFRAEGPNRLWVADITYVPTLSGFLYLAVVLDAWSRRIVGWSMASSLHATLVLDALEMAIQARKPVGVIHHSDQGSQYTSIAFGNRCREAGVRPSMGSVGDAYDNAMCETFFATLECELLARTPRATHSEARRAIFAFIEGWYNTRRRHSAIGYVAPAAFEDQCSPADETHGNNRAAADPKRTLLAVHSATS
jgi:putative transposase